MKVSVGQTVTYVAMGGDRRTVVVQDLDEKNGRPVFDGVMPDGDLVWGYFDQVIRIH